MIKLIYVGIAFLFAINGETAWLLFMMIAMFLNETKL
jgi:hypothetical protein